MSLQIKRIISQIFLKELIIPDKVLLTVTKVELTSNLRIAKIYFSIFNHNNSCNIEKIQSFLNKEKKNIRFRMGKSLQSRYVPGINFYYDHELSTYDKINKLLKND